MRPLAALLLLGLLTSCRTSGALVDTSPSIKDAKGTLTGRVLAGDGDSPLVGREVVAVETRTGDRYTSVSTQNGGFRFLVPPGTYRLELTLREGETLLKAPDDVHVKHGDVDSRADVRVQVAPSSH